MVSTRILFFLVFYKLMVMLGAATTAVRDQIIRHNPNSDIFNAYLDEKVRFDVQSAFLGDDS
jgi:hypothetical protein